MVRLNYAAALYNRGEQALAAKHFAQFEGIVKNRGVEQFDPEVGVCVCVCVWCVMVWVCMCPCGWAFCISVLVLFFRELI